MARNSQLTQHKAVENLFRLKPLIATMRLVITGSLVAGSVGPVYAELPIPVAGQGWVNGGKSSAEYATVGNTLNITQHKDKVILNWEKFNVGKQNIVNFDQKMGASSIALNRIKAEDGLPSKILGKINANGQVYLYNKNGFVFGKDSIVNANSFLATTLNISDEVFKRGITQVFNENGTAALGDRPDVTDESTAVNKASSIVFEKGLKTDKDGFLIDTNNSQVLDQLGKKILVEQGFDTNAKGQLIGANGKVVLNQSGKAIVPVAVKAKLHVEKNGRIIIVAPTIENNGSLSADKQGQIIMAASQDKVYLQAADKDSPFAGLVVEVDTGGKVTNEKTGEILARQGNITMAGFAVNQKGRVNATTSVNINGSIRLLAQEQHGTQGTKLVATRTNRDVDLNDGLGTEAKTTFSAGSVTKIDADADGGSAIDELAQPDSYLQVTGNTVQVKSGATIKVPAGKINITATDNLADPTQGTKGRIVLEKGALIDASGKKGVVAPIERNVGEVSVQSFELRDSPLQRTGILKGKTIRVDLRKGSKIVDTSGAEARISRGINERLTEGGEINFTSSGDVVINDGAKIDISGGSVNYQEGFISTTMLMTNYGRLVDISDADPNEHYVSIFGVVEEKHTKWGVSKVWDLLGPGQFENGYVEGKDAGSFNIKAPRLAWNGNFTAGSKADRFQRELADIPSGGNLDINMAVFQSQQNVRFQTAGNQTNIDVDDGFPQGGNQQPADLVLSTALLTNSGVDNISVKTFGNATLVDGASINMQPAGNLTVEAANIDVNGSIKAAGGSINLKAANNSVATNSGRLQLGKNAALDVSGLWVNDLEKGLAASPTDPLAIAGGKVKLQAEVDLLVNKGSSIRADGGAWLKLNGDLKAGKGGDITLAAVGTDSEPSKLTLGATMSAYGLEQNGSLTLESGKIIVGKPGDADGITDALLLSVSNGNFDVSQQLAFNKINLVANFDNLTVKSNVNLDLRAKNLELQSGYLTKTTGSSLRDFTKVVELPEHLRQPLQVALEGLIGVKIETGSSVKADKGSTISVLSKVGGIFVDGQLQADAGKINLDIKPLPGLEYDAKQAIWVGENARLLAQGTTRLNPADLFGRSSGQVLAGGEINLNAERGAVVLVEGSLLDVSGTSAQLDILQPAKNNIDVYAKQTIASDAGKIKLTAAEGIVLDGTLKGGAGSSKAHGGTLELKLDRSKREPPQIPQIPFPSNPLVINVSQVARRSLDEDISFGDNFPVDLNGQATLSADKVSAGGFTDLSLSSEDQVLFVGDVNLTTAERINIDTKVISAVGENGADAGKVNLNTVFLQLGSSLNPTIAESADTGTGQFIANAHWIQLKGASQWNGFSNIALNSKHDIRTIGLINATDQRDFVGGLVTAADLDLHASQIYPSTLTNFTFAVKNNPDGHINITGKNTDASPLSAGGTLTFEASVINQQGVLKAPLGTITLKADKSLTLAAGSLTSVSAKGQVIPFGVTQGGLDWLYPLDSLRNLVFDTPPEKRLVFAAPEIAVNAGSVVDVSGGGDLFSYEFQPGAGGSNDYLQPGSASYQGGFAILPKLGSQLAPYDHYESQGFQYALGSTVVLGGSEGLPAGKYTILPAHYALLPGAFLITPQADSQDLAATQFTVDGLAIVPGYQMQAGTGIRDARSSGFLIESSADVRTHSKFDIKTANQFFQERATKNETATPVLPRDGGQISLIAQTKLIMDGQFMVAALTGGRGAKMDIAANRINVVNQLSEAPVDGTLEILDEDLSALNVDSLLLGGARSRNKTNSAETDIEVSAQDVVFSANAHLRGPEIIAVATDLVEVQAGVSLEADQQASSGDSVLNIKGDGALMRLSGDKQVVLNRTETSGVKGELRVAAGSTLKSSKSLLLDASYLIEILGDIQMHGGSLNLGANTINIGEVDNLGGNALNLSNLKLANWAVDELVLTGRNSIGVYGNVGKVNADGSLLTDVNGLPQAIKFDRLVINTAGFTGHGTATDRARLQAGSMTLQNTGAATNQQAVDGQGQLDLLADTVKIGNGSFAIQGFKTLNINAAKEFRAVGKGSLDVAADLNVTSAVLTTDGGSNVKLNAAGYQAKFNGLNSAAAVASGFGGALEVIADTIDFNAKAVLASGSFGLHALTGDVKLGQQASFDLAGRAVKFADQTDYTSGGHFKAVADHGKVLMAAGSMVDIDSGGGKAAGGSLTLQAPDQSVVLLGQLQAAAGSAALDVNDFDATADFNALLKVLNDAGINQSIYFRTRNADIVQNTTSSINANKVTLVADSGEISVAGAIHADAADQGGSIQLFAGDGITLANGADLTALATANGGKGGQVLLSSVDTDNDGFSGIDIQSGSSIDVSGKGAKGGEVTLRALRTSNGINIQPVAGSINGYSKFYAEGVKKYANTDLGNDGQLNTADITKIKTQTAAYMTATNMKNVANLAPGMRLTAGVEINYNGNLTLKDAWDLATWRYDDVADSNVWDDLPGRLVIKTSGNFKAEKSLSDGFKTGSINFPGSTTPVNIVDKLQGGESWSYNLVAGADAASADINAATNIGALLIGSNAVIRTGSGDMQLSAGGDITFTDGTSSVYNAGHPTETSPYGSLKDRFVGLLFYSEYPVDGGDLKLEAGGNINGAVATNNDLNDWLLRIGTWTNTDNHTGQRPTAWGVALGYSPNASSQNPAKSTKPLFQQNVGSFGGGNVSVSAGGNISNLEVMMPTTGKQIGTADNSSAASLNFLTNQVEVNGGGTMQISAGGNIAGGTYYLGKGTGTMTAGGEVVGGNSRIKGPDLLIGDTQFSVNAGSGVNLTGVSDPMILHKADVNFFSYSATSKLNVASLSGDVLLGSNGSIFPRSNANSSQQSLARTYPGSLHASAFSGNIELTDAITMFPAANAELSLFAEQDIFAQLGISFSMSDGDRALLPFPEIPLARNQMALVNGLIGANATLPVHIGDSQPARLVSRHGNIENIIFNLPKKVLVNAGQDIINLSLFAQHVNEDDVSLIEAARDISYTSGRDPVTGALLNNTAKIEIGGPGEVLVKTGRNVDLGASDGISTVGNVVNTNLPDQGANLTILTGANGELDYAGFIETYLPGNDQYNDASLAVKSLITDFMRERLNDPSLSETDALEAFAALKTADFVAIQPQLNAIILPVFFNEIKESGSASAGTKALGNERGFAVIEALFPGSDWKGDLSMFFSKIHTVDNGNINLLVPGGQVNTGLAVSFAGAKSPSELGIVAQREGNINVMVHNDFLVNTSRVFSLDGGDIMIWSSEGDIDAGRGAKSSIAAPPPLVSFDKNGNLKIEFPPVVSGSGIRTAGSSDGVKGGDVYLFAPKGVVDAGEAGIGGTNVTISATAVLGATNIQVSGVGTGVPVASTGSLAAGLTGTSNLTAGVSQAAESSVSANTEKDKSAMMKNTVLGMLSVEVLGFGE